MIEDSETGIKIAESPREALIKNAISATENRINQMELGLELERNALDYLKKLG